MSQRKETENTALVGTSTTVEVNLPSCIQVDLVQGNEFRQYEIFSGIASLSLTIAVSFWTSYIINSINNSILFSALTFSGSALLTGGIAIYHRSKLYGGRVKKIMPLGKFEDKKE